MQAYKFLDRHLISPITGTAWSPDVRVEAAAAVPCREGVHACRPDDLAHWLSDRLFVIELDGDIVEGDRKLVATRGRLVGEVGGYREALAEMSETMAWAARDRAVAVLRDEGDTTLADRFAAATTMPELAALVPTTGSSTFGRLVAGLAADVADDTLNGTPAQAPFVAACLAGTLAAGPDGDAAAYEAGIAAERVAQSRWLVDRLGL